MSIIDDHLGGVPPSVDPDTRAWLAAIIGEAGAAIGLDTDGLPGPWATALSRVGVPLARGGELRWDRDLRTDATTVPVVDRHDGACVLPPLTRFALLTSLPLKPLRLFVFARLGVRLKVAAGVHMRLFADHAVLVSTCDLPLGGFLIGPRPGARTSLEIPPLGVQVVGW